MALFPCNFMAMDEEELFQSEEELRPIIVSCLCQYPMCAHPLSLFAPGLPLPSFKYDPLYY